MSRQDMLERARPSSVWIIGRLYDYSEGLPAYDLSYFYVEIILVAPYPRTSSPAYMTSEPVPTCEALVATNPGGRLLGELYGSPIGHGQVSMHVMQISPWCWNIPICLYARGTHLWSGINEDGT